MSPVTIPKELARRGDLVVMPRDEYEAMLRIIRQKVGTPIHRRLVSALKEVRDGKLIGPFKDAQSLMKSLNKKR